jgi:ASPIC and UnbV/FG-GAP-like repeat
MGRIMDVERIPILGPLCRRIDREGEYFFESGRMLVNFLNRLAGSLKQSRMADLPSFYDQGFQGKKLGLMDLSPGPEIDGIGRSAFRPSDIVINSHLAAAEWHAYMAGFSHIEELALHVHRMEDWKRPGTLTASVRFELIGTRRGETVSGIDRAYFRMTWRVLQNNAWLRAQSLIEGDSMLCREPHFQSVGQAAGIDFTNEYYPGFLNQPLKFAMLLHGPGGITVADYDNDGFYDLFIPDGVSSRLFRNRRDGTFEDVTEAAGLSGLDGVSAAAFADYDNDGFKDLFVSRTFGPNQLFHNNGDGTFRDVTRESGIGADNCTTAIGWADYDNDGFLDLYVGRYLDPRKRIPTTFYSRNGEPNQLYHNNGDGTFTNVTEQAGVGEKGLCLAVVWGDYNDDGRPDLYVVNDFGRKTLYRNNGDGTFTDVTVKSGTLAYGAGMNASFADYDNDGKFDYYVTHIRSEFAWIAEAPTIKRYMLSCMNQGTWKSDMPLFWEIVKQTGLNLVRAFQAMSYGNNLLHNRGDGTFEDTTDRANANPPGWFWGASFADFDNDGWQDLYAANGWIYNDPDTELEMDFLNDVVTKPKVYKTGIYFDPKHFGRSSWHGFERNRHLRNNGDGTFTEVGRATGTDLILNSRGVAVADFWNRGVMDIAVAASGDKHALLKNYVGTRRNWLQVELVGSRSNRDAVGARIILHTGGQMQAREVVLGDGYGSQNSLRQHFGLDQHRVAGKLVVRWPTSGIVQVFENVAANQIVEITEGSSDLVTKHYSAIPEGAYASSPV